jgi:hypothetical protein
VVIKEQTQVEWLVADLSALLLGSLHHRAQCNSCEYDLLQEFLPTY